MSYSKFVVAFIVVAAVIGVASAVGGNWWTFGAMVLAIIGQLLGQRARRRSSEKNATPDH